MLGDPQERPGLLSPLVQTRLCWRSSGSKVGALPGLGEPCHWGSLRTGRPLRPGVHAVPRGLCPVSRSFSDRGALLGYWNLYKIIYFV